MKLEDCKVGMRVAVYTGGYRVCGTITEVNERSVYVIFKKSQITFRYHPYQLRKLVPKKKEESPPKEVWVRWYANYKDIQYATPQDLSDEDFSSVNIKRAVRYVLAEDK